MFQYINTNVKKLRWTDGPKKWNGGWIHNIANIIKENSSGGYMGVRCIIISDILHVFNFLNIREKVFFVKWHVL